MARGKSGKGAMTGKAAARIQSAAAKSGGGKASKGSFAARAQRAAARNGPALVQPGGVSMGCPAHNDSP